MEPTNPFITHGYSGELYFCDRHKETKFLIKTLENGRNVTLISLRRMGKTGLIHHVHKKMKKWRFVYVDVLHTDNLKDFTNSLGKAVINQLESPVARTMKRLTSIFRKFKPTMVLDPYSGLPTFELNVQTQQESETTLEDLFDYLKKQKQKTIVAIDEFQQIDSYPEKKTAALLRSHIQQVTNVQFIFSGSQKHLLTNMFTSASAPFYQSSQLMFLEGIPASDYVAFIQKHFQRYKKSIPADHIHYLLTWCGDHTYYVQLFCHKLFMNTAKTVDRTTVEQTEEQIMSENESYFLSYKNLLTEHQWNLVKAIAKEGKVKQLNKKDFLSRYRLSASSVSRSIKALHEREVVTEDNGEFRVYDVFLGQWIKKNF